MFQIHWLSLLRIAASWFISPLISGVVSFLLYYVIKKCIINSKNPMKSGLRALPVAYGLTFAINILSVLFDGSKHLGLDKLPVWVIFVSAIGVGILTGILVLLVIVPYQRKKLLKDPSLFETKEEKPVEMTVPSVIVQDESNLNQVNKTVTVSSSTIESGIAMSKNDSFATLEQVEAGDAEKRKCVNVDAKMEKNHKIKGAEPNATEHPAVAKLFSFLQILTATFGSFAHGGNDVSNAIGPLIAVWTIFEEGSVKQNSETPILILLYGGIGISVGLWCLGHRVIRTVGNDLVAITPTSGFSIEASPLFIQIEINSSVFVPILFVQKYLITEIDLQIASAATVLMASKAGLPISTTHCKVGSVICVGWASNGKNQVSWNTFRNIAFAWLLTVPASCAISAFCVWVLQPVFI